MTPLILRQSPIRSYKMWKEGFRNLTMLDHAHAKRSGHLWGMLGGFTACIFLILQVPMGKNIMNGAATLGFGTLTGAIAYLQFVEWRKQEQQVYELKKMKEMIG